MTAHNRCFGIGFLCLVATATPADSAIWSQAYPAGPVKFITQMAPGSGTDPAMRIVIDHLAKLWGQQTVLVNQPGAGGLLAAGRRIRRLRMVTRCTWPLLRPLRCFR
jgi:tripartite-type tricarboxylate transporter receptor subunit TctC